MPTTIAELPRLAKEVRNILGCASISISVEMVGLDGALLEIPNIEAVYKLYTHIHSNMYVYII